LSVTIREDAVVADAHEAARQDVEQEAAKKLGRAQADDSLRTAVRVVLADEAHEALIHGEDAPVRDRHAVRVAAEVFQDAVGTAEGRFGVDDPVDGT